MSDLLIKGIPDTLYDMLKKRAAEDFRSLTQEVIWMLSKSAMEGEKYSDNELKKLEQMANKLRHGKKIENMIQLDNYLRSLKK